MKQRESSRTLLIAILSMTTGLAGALAGCNEPGQSRPASAVTSSSAHQSAAPGLESCGQGVEKCEVPQLPVAPPVPENSSGQKAAIPPSAPHANPSAAADAANHLGFSLIPSMLSGNGNAIFSPFSIAAALAMAAAGADGATEAQILSAFGRKGQGLALQSDFPALLRVLDTRELRVASRVWVEKTFPVLPSFTAITREAYLAPAALIDLVAQPESSRKEINAWVSERTNQRIRDLLHPGDINADTRVILTNAIYFKAAWEKAFKPGQTSDGAFTTADGRKIQVPMMHQRAKAHYTEKNGFKAISLPYKGGAFSAVFVLPPEGQATPPSTALLESTLKELASGFPAETDISLPKFKFDVRTDLVQRLNSIGITDAFLNGQADFSKIDGKKDLVISKAVHQAFIEVNEEGTEAAAATGMMMGITGMPMQLKVFRADRPFFLFIRGPSGTILFAAKVADPGQLK